MSSVQQNSADFVVESRAAGSAREDFGHLTSGCGVFDLDCRAKVEITGSHRVRWLNSMISNNVRDLPAGQGVYGFLLTPQGRIQGDLYAYQRGNSLLLDLDVAQVEKVLGILRRYIIMDDVKLTDVSGNLKAIGLAGPRSGPVLKGAGIDIVELQPLQFAEFAEDLDYAVGHVRIRRQIEFYEIGKRFDDHFHRRVVDDRIRQRQTGEPLQAAELRQHDDRQRRVPLWRLAAEPLSAARARARRFRSTRRRQ